MSRQWYGSLNNRIEENRMYGDEIVVGMGVTKYLWSDRHAYEVVDVKDQKHVSIREYDHKRPDDGKDYSYSNDWVLVSNENNPIINLTKRGKYWYATAKITVDEAKAILNGDDIDAKIWAGNWGFRLSDIIEKGKAQTKYDRWNVSFGVAEYYYDFEF